MDLVGRIRYTFVFAANKQLLLPPINSGISEIKGSFFPFLKLVGLTT